ncbi:family 20 glycosylhydrolase [Blastopirellula marina]|uniref:beta-N-acetylhexosaminidase n=1 Tax=Blastopirellula marina TaxID=124 RepID=A0A2S8GS26_9BACT|nr:family 20 glycosylhydrolase [Blastopirellula marina]PQO47226.1 hypothetical protein C5Y93_04080 [Blastopirellula marina]
MTIALRPGATASHLFRQVFATSLLLIGALASVAHSAQPPALTPPPKSLQLQAGTLSLTANSSIAATDQALLPLARILADEIFLSSTVKLAVKEGTGSPGDIVLQLATPADATEAYQLTIDKQAVVSAGNYQAVALGTTTLLQLIQADGDQLNLPKLKIADQPDHPFRSVMLDLARRWHPLDTLKETIELARLAKLRYLHLHLSDNQSCTFTSTAFPKLATPGRSYTQAEWKELVQYADQRGITIIPEIDMPGHSGAWVSQAPEAFGTVDPETGKAVSLGIVNMVNEKSYESLDILIGELCETFASSPYIHIGADEIWAENLKELPEYQPYVKQHGLTLAQEGDIGELICHFIVRVNKIVRQHGRQSIAWSGFHHDGTKNVKIPHDIIVMTWDTNPNLIADAGFPVINACWIPLYMVPSQSRGPTAEMIYDWYPQKFDGWYWGEAIDLDPAKPVLGAQICMWEQRYNEVIPILQERVFALNERLWNAEPAGSFADFAARQQPAQQLASQILYPLQIEVAGLLEEGRPWFTDQLEVALSTKIPGAVIRFETGDRWETFPTADSPVYQAPIEIAQTATLAARVYDSQNRPLGGTRQLRFSKIEPAYTYRLLGPIPRTGWEQLPDFAKLTEFATGVAGRMTRDRAQQINRSMFAQLPAVGMIDTRAAGVFNPHAIELNGTLRVPATGEYVVKFVSWDGQGRLLVDDQTLDSDRDREQTLTLKQGEFPFTLQHYFRRDVNNLNLLVKPPGSDKFVPFETMVLPLKDF